MADFRVSGWIDLKFNSGRLSVHRGYRLSRSIPVIANPLKMYAYGPLWPRQDRCGCCWSYGVAVAGAFSPSSRPLSHNGQLTHPELNP